MNKMINDKLTPQSLRRRQMPPRAAATSQISPLLVVSSLAHTHSLARMRARAHWPGRNYDGIQKGHYLMSGVNSSRGRGIIARYILRTIHSECVNDEIYIIDSVGQI